MAAALTYRQKKLEDQALVREIFHELSQPLTALQCMLELALRRDSSVEDLRVSVEKALENANNLRQRLALVRALDDACDPGDPSEATDLCDLLRELHDDMLPLFDSAGKELRLELKREVVMVRGERPRLLRAMFYFLEYLFRYSTRQAVIIFRLDVTKDGQAELKINAETSLPMSPPEAELTTHYSCEAEMVRRSLRALGGDFALSSDDAHQSVWLGTVPLAEIAGFGTV